MAAKIYNQLHIAVLHTNLDSILAFSS